MSNTKEAIKVLNNKANEENDMSNLNQKGFVKLALLFLVVAGLLFAVFFVRFKLSNEVVSGVVYNTKNNTLIGDNTTFSVRASENTYVSEENRSSYCLPPNSEHKDLINRSAQDKNVKVVVEAKKYFAVQAPWTCKDNVTVREVN